MRAKKPVSPAYPSELKTIGDHIRKKRLDQNMYQKQVAEILDCTTDSVCYWENNRTQPSIEFIPLIIQFLGYNPFEDISSGSLAERILAYRKMRGLKQDELARQLGIDPSTLGRWENGNGVPWKEKAAVLNELLCSESFTSKR